MSIGKAGHVSRHLTPDQQQAVIAHFEEWSGGYTPRESDLEQVRAYFSYAADATLNQEALWAFLATDEHGHVPRLPVAAGTEDLEKLHVQNRTIELDGSFYYPVFYPDGTNPTRPVLLVRADHVVSITSRLDAEAKKMPL